MSKINFFLLFTLILSFFYNCTSPRKACYESKCGTSTGNCVLQKSLLSNTSTSNNVIQKESDTSLRNQKTNDYIKGSLPLDSFRSKIEISAAFKDSRDVDNYYFQPQSTVSYSFSSSKSDVASCSIYLYSSDQANLSNIGDNSKDPATLKTTFTKKKDISSTEYHFSLKNEKSTKKYSYLFVHCKPKDASKIKASTGYSFKIENKQETVNSLKQLAELKTASSYTSYLMNKELKKGVSGNAASSLSCQQSKASCYSQCDSAFPF